MHLQHLLTSALYTNQSNSIVIVHLCCPNPRHATSVAAAEREISNMNGKLTALGLVTNSYLTTTCL